MFDNHVRRDLGAASIFFVLAFLGTNAVFTRSVTAFIAAILILSLIPLALLTLERGQARRRLQPVRATFDDQTDASDLMRMDSDKG